MVPFLVIIPFCLRRESLSSHEFHYIAGHRNLSRMKLEHQRYLLLLSATAETNFQLKYELRNPIFPELFALWHSTFLFLSLNLKSTGLLIQNSQKNSNPLLRTSPDKNGLLVIENFIKQIFPKYSK